MPQRWSLNLVSASHHHFCKVSALLDLNPICIKQLLKLISTKMLCKPQTQFLYSICLVHPLSSLHIEFPEKLYSVLFVAFSISAAGNTIRQESPTRTLASVSVSAVTGHGCSPYMSKLQPVCSRITIPHHSCHSEAVSTPASLSLSSLPCHLFLAVQPKLRTYVSDTSCLPSA